MPSGYLALVLHAHLPFVRHPEYEDFLEEDWLYEALSETYLPLLKMLDGFERDGVRACFTLTCTPPLCEMLADPLLQSRYLKRLEKLEALSELEVQRTQGTPFAQTALLYREHFAECRAYFVGRWKQRVLDGFKQYQEAGYLEIITCGATHGFLPLMVTEAGVRAQLKVAVDNYQKHFGRAPRGIWLPECAYHAGLDRYLKEVGLEFFFLDTHGVAFATPKPVCGPYRPIRCAAGPHAFARDPESSKQVWSSVEGYPGDANYRELYRDLGFDGDYEAIRPFLHLDGVRRNLGLKYHRITGSVPLHEKLPYQPAAAREKAVEHAGHFFARRVKQSQWLKKLLGAEPIIVAPYDAELFGHWWFEGPWFLDALLRKVAAEQDADEGVCLTTPSRFLALFPEQPAAEPNPSSWGDRGFYEYWLNPTNDWVYRHLHVAEVRMGELARQFEAPTPLEKRALNQISRELLLAQSSDWAFIMTTGTTVAYAEKRTRDHLGRFDELYHQLTHGSIDEAGLSEMERRDNIFQELDYRVYAG